MHPLPSCRPCLPAPPPHAFCTSPIYLRFFIWLFSPCAHLPWIVSLIVSILHDQNRLVLVFLTLNPGSTLTRMGGACASGSTPHCSSISARHNSHSKHMPLLWSTSTTTQCLLLHYPLDTMRKVVLPTAVSLFGNAKLPGSNSNLSRITVGM